MRMSCNGCRVLRKGCSEDCTLRPCLQWIKTPESQANATVFLAKFYGRAGLVNLINAGPEHLRPEVFKSLLYEACGRIINPIYGSVGLMWSGNWKRVQDGVESILQGSPLMMHNQQQQEQGQSTTVVRHPNPILKGSDIRHLSKDSSVPPSTIHHRTRTRNRFKRPCTNIITNNTNNNNNNVVVVDSVVTSQENDDELMTEQPIRFSITGWVDSDDQQQQNQQQQQEKEEEEGLMMMMNRAQSHDSFSVETVEPSLIMNQTATHHHDHDVKSESIITIPMMTSSLDNHDHDDEIALDLSLGLNPMRCAAQLSTVAAPPGFNLDVV